jgi:hypothetical protein
MGVTHTVATVVARFRALGRCSPGYRVVTSRRPVGIARTHAGRGLCGGVRASGLLCAAALLLVGCDPFAQQAECEQVMDRYLAAVKRQDTDAALQLWLPEMTDEANRPKLAGVLEGHTRDLGGLQAYTLIEVTLEMTTDGRLCRFEYDTQHARKPAREIFELHAPSSGEFRIAYHKLDTR